MYLFWWTGKGYFTPVILVATLLVFSLILKVANPLFADTQSFWGASIIVAGIVNWFVGRRQNSKKISAVRSTKLKDRLLYRARHKFMSLPFETWAIPLVAFGIYMIIEDVIGT